MLRLFVILIALAIIGLVARRIWLAVLQLRVGAVPEGVDVPDVPLEADRGWQVTRTTEAAVTTVRAEHPVQGVERSWTIHLRDPGAVAQLDAAMRAAGRLVAQRSRDVESL